MTALLAPAPPAATAAAAQGAPSRTAPGAQTPPRRPRRPAYLRPVASVAGEVEAAEAIAPAPLVTLSPAPSPTVRVVRARDVFDEDVTPLRSLTGPAADPARVCMSILQVAAEAMRGLRPLVQLARWVDEAIFSELASFAPSHGSRSSVRQRLAPASTAAVLARARFRKVRVARISPHVAECTVLVEVDDRVRAVVVRLEERRTAWRATALETV